MLSITDIRKLDVKTRIGLIVVVDIILTAITGLYLTNGFVSAIYNDFVIASPTIWYPAPQSMLIYSPIFDGIFFICVFGLLYLICISRMYDIMKDM